MSEYPILDGIVSVNASNQAPAIAGIITESSGTVLHNLPTMGVGGSLEKTMKGPSWWVMLAAILALNPEVTRRGVNPAPKSSHP